jgi:hypothetical protein
MLSSFYLVEKRGGKSKHFEEDLKAIGKYPWK